MRDESREQLGAVSEADFATHFPPWEGLSKDVQKSKMVIAHDELLQVLDRAGYVVRKKRSK